MPRIYSSVGPDLIYNIFFFSTITFHDSSGLVELLEDEDSLVGLHLELAEHGLVGSDGKNLEYQVKNKIMLMLSLATSSH